MKKKIIEATPAPMSFERQYSDNNPDGVLLLPGNGTDPSDYNNDSPNTGTKKYCFHSKIGETESPNKFGGVNAITANGVASSRGEGNNNDHNYDEGTDGIWNKNRNWKGGNLTGF